MTAASFGPWPAIVSKFVTGNVLESIEALEQLRDLYSRGGSKGRTEVP